MSIVSVKPLAQIQSQLAPPSTERGKPSKLVSASVSPDLSLYLEDAEKTYGLMPSLREDNQTPTNKISDFKRGNGSKEAIKRKDLQQN